MKKGGQREKLPLQSIVLGSNRRVIKFPVFVTYSACFGNVTLVDIRPNIDC